KNYAYIKINLKQDFPHFEVSRKLDKNSLFFGPYFAGIGAKDVLDIINYAYPVRKCKINIKTNSKPIKPCLFYDMHLCNAPCANKVTKEEYRKVLNDAIKFLKGDTKKIESILQNKMQITANSENFETALKLRDKLKMLNRLKEKVFTQLTKNVNYDVFSLVTLGELSAMCVMIVRGGKILGIQTFDILNYLEKNEAYTQFIVQYYSNRPFVCDEIILPKNIDISNINLFLNTKYAKKIIVFQPEKGTKYQLLKMCEKNAILDIEKNTEKIYKIRNASIGAITQLKKDLKLQNLPNRIECYDISNTFGTNTVASMSVLINGLKAPKHYRKFKINTVNFIDDFASMKETLFRRFEKMSSDDVSFASMPDLIIIDGGKGQLSSALEITQQFEYKNDIISLAKRLEEVFLPQNKESIILEKSSYSLHLIQLARDEAHRFAITYNRNLRNKSTFKGGLEAIEGVGGVTRKKLLACFKTLDKIKNASFEELKSADGINKNVAKNIFDYYHND
ncbi:MAG: excinuclease ABC subunit UvrC, partial [Clostridia bacterium]|nr:excinuclease ABC subunit UvrC [Clostridia bacterium]